MSVLGQACWLSFKVLVPLKYAIYMVLAFALCDLSMAVETGTVFYKQTFLKSEWNDFYKMKFESKLCSVTKF